MGKNKGGNAHDRAKQKASIVAFQKSAPPERGASISEFDRKTEREKPHRYWWRFMSIFGEECYRTWRQELMASVVVGIIAFFIEGANYRLALSTLLNALLATGLTFAAFALWHLVATPYRMTHPERIHAKNLSAWFGVGVTFCMIAGALYFVIHVSKNYMHVPPAASAITPPPLAPAFPPSPVAAKPPPVQPTKTKPADTPRRGVTLTFPFRIDASLDKAVRKIASDYFSKHPSATEKQAQEEIMKIVADRGLIPATAKPNAVLHIGEMSGGTLDHTKIVVQPGQQAMDVDTFTSGQITNTTVTPAPSEQKPTTPPQ